MKRTFAIAIGIALMGVSACQTPDSGSAGPGSFFIVKTERTAFFERGPAQDYGPDFNLSKGQEVEMIERSFGFSRVKTDIGKVGYVSTEDLEPAPPRPDPAPEPRSYSTGSSSSSSSSSSIDYNDVVTDFPAAENEPTPVTSFRY